MLFAAAWLSWSEARLAARVADARQQMATLQFQLDDTLKPAARFPTTCRARRAACSANIRRIRATVAYWIGGYDDVIEEGSQEVDAEILLTAANAAFRASERAAGAPQQEQVQRLDGVLQAYASVLKASPRHADAAYNYEYVSRVRDEVASRVPGKTPAAPVAAAGRPATAQAATCPRATPFTAAPAGRRPRRRPRSSR